MEEVQGYGNVISPSYLFLLCGDGSIPVPVIFLSWGCVYVIHFFSFPAIFAGALPVPAVDRAGVVVLLHGSQGGRGGG